MENKRINIAVIGAGYAAFLHGNGYGKVGGVPICLHTICDVDFPKAQKLQADYGYLKASADFDQVLADPEVDVIDIVTPPFLHTEMIKKALAAGKNVICEKPLTGYLGRPGDPTPIGDKVAKAQMYHVVNAEAQELKAAAAAAAGHFYYAENYVYAPSIQKMAQIISRKKSRILSIKAVSSLKGSSSPMAGFWDKNGGGCWARNGVHPLGGILWLKQVEAQARGVEIHPAAVFADMARVSAILSEEEHRHIAARPVDVEDLALVSITFSDGTKAAVYCSDVCLGGTSNYLDVYTNDAALEGRMTNTGMLNTYMLDEDGLDDYFLGEMLPIKTGWNRAFVVDEVLRGHAGELQAFMEALSQNRDSDSNMDLACQVTQVLYAAYQSAEEGRVVQL